MFDINNFYGQGAADERVMLLDEPKSAFMHRIYIIESARFEINFTTYSVYKGNSTYIFFAALLNAADRGVKVNITVDGKFGKIPQKIRHALISHKNVTLTDYNPFNILKLKYLNKVQHDKLITVDNKYMIIGGRNLGNRFYEPDGYDGILTLDREVLVYNPKETGGSIEKTRKYFVNITNSGLSATRKKISAQKAEKGRNYRNIINTVYVDFMEKSALELAKIDYEKSPYIISVNKITILTNPVEKGDKFPNIAYNFYNIAKEIGKLTIQTPYVVLKARDRLRLKELKDSISEIKIVTDCLASTPNPLAFSTYYVLRKKLLKTGADFYEYQGKYNFHAKAYIFGDRLCAIGSFNFDERSIRRDAEIMLVIDSPEFTSVISGDIKEFTDLSLKVGRDNKYIYNPKVPENKVALHKKIFYPIMGVLFWPFRYFI